MSTETMMRTTTYPATRQGFLAAYQAEIERRYGKAWAADEDKVAKAMARVAETLGGLNTWNWDGPATFAAWRAIGRKDRLKLSSLRALPVEAV